MCTQNYLYLPVPIIIKVLQFYMYLYAYNIIHRVQNNITLKIIIHTS